MKSIEDLERELDLIMNPARGKPKNPSKYDTMKRDNKDISIDEAVKNNGGRFAVCNLDLLEV